MDKFGAARSRCSFECDQPKPSRPQAATAHHAVEIIRREFARFSILEIFNADQGSQFTAAEFTQAILARGAKVAMDGRDA